MTILVPKTPKNCKVTQFSNDINEHFSFSEHFSEYIKNYTSFLVNVVSKLSKFTFIYSKNVEIFDHSQFESPTHEKSQINNVKELFAVSEHFIALKVRFFPYKCCLH